MLMKHNCFMSRIEVKAVLGKSGFQTKFPEWVVNLKTDINELKLEDLKMVELFH